MNIPIFLSTDDNYIIPTAVLITSILENTSEKCKFYILHNSLKKTAMDKLKSFEKKYTHSSIEFIEVEDEQFKNVPLMRHFKIANYYRFLIPKLLVEIPKGIYLDGDMVVDFDIKKLFDINLGQYPLAAAVEKCMWIADDCIEHSNSLGIKNENYLNSGVLLLDLKYFRENNLVKKLFETTEEIKDKIRAVDQDVFNVVFKDNYLKLDYSYNVLPSILTKLKEIDDEDYKALTDIKVYHFAGELKPWNSDVEYSEIWFKYAKKLPFKHPLQNFKAKRDYGLKFNEKIFSFKNFYRNNQKRKILTVLGFTKEFI